MKISIKMSVNRSIQLLLAFLFIVNLGEGLFSPILAVFVTNSLGGASLKTVGFAVAFFALTKSVIQIPLARRIDKQVGERDDFYVMMAGSVVSTLYAFGFLLISSSWHLYLLSILGGVGAACLMAAYYGIFARHVDKGSEGFEWSLFSVGGLTIAVAIGATLGGLLADTVGFRITFLLAGILSALATVLLLFLYPYLEGFKKKT